MFREFLVVRGEIDQGKGCRIDEFVRETAQNMRAIIDNVISVTDLIIQFTLVLIYLHYKVSIYEYFQPLQAFLGRHSS